MASFRGVTSFLFVVLGALAFASCDNRPVVGLPEPDAAADASVDGAVDAGPVAVSDAAADVSTATR